MAGEWQVNSLGEVIDVKHGFAFRGELIHDEPRGDVLLTPGNFAIGGGFKGDKFKYYDGSVPEEFVLRKGELLVTMTDLSKEADTLGYPAFVPARTDGRRYLHNQRLGKILVKAPNTLCERYLHYLMCSAEYRHEVLASATGTTVKHTSPERIRRFRFLRPPLDEQRAIAHILGTLDDKVELNRRMNQTLEAMARALFKSWFVDFDPLRAKADGRDLGLPKSVADLFLDRFEDSELGEVPMGWGSGRLDEVTGFLGGYAFQSQDWVEHGVPVVKIGSVKPGIVDLSATSFVSRQVAAAAQRYRLGPGDLLIGMTGYVGEVGLVPHADNPPLLNQRVGKFVLEIPGTSALAFLYCLTRQPEFKTQVESKSHGTAQANVSAEAILSIPIVVPPRSLRSKFNRIAQPLLDRILANHAESRTLAALRDMLLPKLLSGEMRVSPEWSELTVGTCA